MSSRSSLLPSNHFSKAARTSYALVLPLLMALVPTPASAEAVVHVEPGGIARWSGEDVVSCGMDGRTFAALEGTCYYPIDFERAAGIIEIARWRRGAQIETGWLVIDEKDFELQDINFPDDRYVNPPPEDLARHYQEQARIKPKLRRRSGAARFTLPLDPPAQPLPEGRYFGVRRTFNGEPKNAHTGADYAIGLGNSIRSVADGTVVVTGEHFFGGNSVYVYHGDGLVSMYLHLDSIGVEEGQDVEQGDELGKSGSTGRSTGPHLHMGFRWRGARVDPNLLLAPPTNLPEVSGEPN